MDVTREGEQALFKAFKEFAFRGNVIDLAVGVILGAAFSGIIKSLVDSIFMPLIGIIIGGIDVKGLSVEVGNAIMKMGSSMRFVSWLIGHGRNKRGGTGIVQSV